MGIPQSVSSQCGTPIHLLNSACNPYGMEECRVFSHMLCSLPWTANKPSLQAATETNCGGVKVPCSVLHTTSQVTRCMQAITKYELSCESYVIMVRGKRGRRRLLLWWPILSNGLHCSAVVHDKNKPIQRGLKNTAKLLIDIMPVTS
jgi:hypothetical protein